MNLQISSYKKWLIWGLAAIFYFYEFVLRVSPSVIVLELMKSFSITASAVGVMSAFYLYAYAPMQIPVGMLMDRFGIRSILSLASIVVGMGTIIFSLAQDVATASFGRFLIGGGSSFAFVAMVYISSHWFPIKRRALLIGTANSIAMLGASAGTGPLTNVISSFGWRISLFGFGLFGLALAACIFSILKSDPTSEKVEKISTDESHNPFNKLQTVAQNPQTWINSIVALCFYMTTTAFGGLWGVTFIQMAYNVSKETAGYAISMVFLGWLIGGPLVGHFSDRLGHRKSTIRMGILLTLLCLMPVIYFTWMPILMVYILMFLVGIFSAAELLNFSLAIELNPLIVKATAAAFTNFMISAGDSIIQPLIGFLLDFGWNGHIVDGIRAYSTFDFKIALSTLPISLMIAFFLTFMIREKTNETVR
ncbi:MAG: MFS transporter [Chlamydiae bacterium]|nr:MFS transporter [Chlamydiota bacterium]